MSRPIDFYGIFVKPKFTYKISHKFTVNQLITSCTSIAGKI